MTSKGPGRSPDSAPAEGTGDYLVPIGTTESGCCVLSSFNSSQPRNEDADPAALPAVLPVNTALSITLPTETVVAVGCAPSGYVAVLSPKDWAWLQRWKLTRLRISGGNVRACGEGRSAGFVAARFLLNAPRNHIVFHRNGNPLDLRRSNIVSISRKLLKQAEFEKARGPNFDGSFKRRDGLWGYRPSTSPSATERVAALMAGSRLCEAPPVTHGPFCARGGGGIGCPY